MASTPSPGRYGLRLYEGKTYRRVFTWAIDGTPVDLTGAAVRATIRKTYNSEDALLELTEGSGLTVDDEAGEITLEVTEEQAVRSLAGVWDLSVRFPNDDDLAILKGSVTVTPTVTH